MDLAYIQDRFVETIDYTGNSLVNGVAYRLIEKLNGIHLESNHKYFVVDRIYSSSSDTISGSDFDISKSLKNGQHTIVLKSKSQFQQTRVHLYNGDETFKITVEPLQTVVQSFNCNYSLVRMNLGKWTSSQPNPSMFVGIYEGNITSEVAESWGDNEPVQITGEIPPFNIDINNNQLMSTGSSSDKIVVSPVKSIIKNVCRLKILNHKDVLNTTTSGSFTKIIFNLEDIKDGGNFICAYLPTLTDEQQSDDTSEGIYKIMGGGICVKMKTSRFQNSDLSTFINSVNLHIVYDINETIIQTQPLGGCLIGLSSGNYIDTTKFDDFYFDTTSNTITLVRDKKEHIIDVSSVGSLIDY